MTHCRSGVTGLIVRGADRADVMILTRLRQKTGIAGTNEKKMAKDNIHRLQDTFLDHLLRRRTPVTIFLANGVRLQGVVAGFDAFCVLLERDGEQQIVYKHSITTTVPAYPVDLREDGDAPAPAPAVEKVSSRPPLIVERKGRRPLRSS
jgi:host factor-I protein